MNDCLLFGQGNLGKGNCTGRTVRPLHYQVFSVFADLGSVRGAGVVTGIVSAVKDGGSDASLQVVTSLVS